jgi:translation elongation factor EF-Tu-like GTPase
MPTQDCVRREQGADLPELLATENFAFDGYAPQFFFRTTNVTGSASVLGGVQMAMPGDGVQLKVSLLQPVAISDGDRFAVREAGKTIGSGTITEVLVYPHDTPLAV